MKNLKIMWILGIILLLLIIVGLIGSSQVSKAGNTCDLGIDSEGSLFCWKWHRNVVGNLQDNLNDFLDGDN